MFIVGKRLGSSESLIFHIKTDKFVQFPRYSVDVNLDKAIVNKDSFKDPAKKRKARRDVKAKLEER